MVGDYLMATNVSARIVDVDVYFIGSDLANSIAKARQLGAWLRTESPEELLFDDDPDVTYYAQLDGSTDLEAIGTYRSGTIRFVCANPYANASSSTTESVSSAAMTSITNAGGAETFPSFEITLDADATFLTIINDTTGAALTIGDAAAADESTAAPMTLNFHDDCTVMDWSYVAVCENGTVQNPPDGEMDTTGKVFYAVDPGVGAGWHGPTVKRAVSGDPLGDFRIRVGFYLKNTASAAQMGRINIYALDGSDNVVGKLGVHDVWSAKAQVRFYAMAGPSSGNHHIVDQLNRNRAAWNNLDWGFMELIRKGKRWTAIIDGYRNAGAELKPGAHLQASWTDEDEDYATAISAVAINIADYGTGASCDKLHVSDVKVWGAPSASDAYFICGANDIFSINMRTGEVLHSPDGESWRRDSDRIDSYGNVMPVSSLVSYDSEFWALLMGTNDIIIESDANAAGTITWRERWL